MAENKKISQLNPAVAFTGAEKFEIVQGGLNLYGTPEQMKEYVGAGPTREFNRAFSSELLFDKNMIEGELHTQTDDITFTVSEVSNLVDQESIYGQRIVTDGVHPIYFSNFNHLANIASGDILEAGTYQFIFWYSNGIVRGSIMLPRQETVQLTPLSIPANFEAVPGTDPETEADLSSEAVPNATTYETDFSTTSSSGPWTNIPTATGLTFTHTGLTPATTYHYRKRAIGDLITFANSGYATAVMTTSDSGDVTDPSFTSSPLDAATDIPVNQVVVITSDEALRDADGVTEITDANILDYLTAVNSTAGAQSITATIDVTKKIITITPNVVWTELDGITITLDGVEDLNGNEPDPFVITFTTSDYTSMENNHLDLGAQIDSFLVGADKDWEVEFEVKNIVLPLTGSRGLFQKHIAAGNQASLTCFTVDSDVNFWFYHRIDASLSWFCRVNWPDALNAFTSGKLAIKYFGANDDALSRVGLFIDDVEVTSGKNIELQNGFPFDMNGSTAPFQLRAPTFREIRNFKVKNNMGATTVVNIPIIRTGIDVSGNDFHGTWI